MEDAVAPGATVLEIGSGPDLLWTLAAINAGSSMVTLDEPLGAWAGDRLSPHVTVSLAADGIHPEYFFRGHLVGQDQAPTSRSAPHRDTQAARSGPR